MCVSSYCISAGLYIGAAPMPASSAVRSSYTDHGGMIHWQPCFYEVYPIYIYICARAGYLYTCIYVYHRIREVITPTVINVVPSGRYHGPVGLATALATEHEILGAQHIQP